MEAKAKVRRGEDEQHDGQAQGVGGSADGSGDGAAGQNYRTVLATTVLIIIVAALVVAAAGVAYKYRATLLEALRKCRRPTAARPVVPLKRARARLGSRGRAGG